jgi:hypothetical protein
LVCNVSLLTRDLIANVALFAGVFQGNNSSVEFYIEINRKKRKKSKLTQMNILSQPKLKAITAN